MFTPAHPAPQPSAPADHATDASVGHRREIVGVLSATSSLLVAISLWSYAPGSASGMTGPAGVLVGDALTFALGALAWGVPVELAWLSVRMLADMPGPLGHGTVGGSLALALTGASACALLSMAAPDAVVYGGPIGGMLGALSVEGLRVAVGPVGGCVLALGTLVACISARTGLRMQRLVLSTRLPDGTVVPPALLPSPAAAEPSTGAGEGRKHPPVAIVGPERIRSGTPDRRAGTCDGQRFALPMPALLEQMASTMQLDRGAVQEQAETIAYAMESHSVRAVIERAHVGPIVTRFEMSSQSVRIGPVQRAASDIALALGVDDVRVLPVPDRKAIGIEVQSAHRRTVPMRSILESDAWSSHRGRLPLVLGTDASGRPVASDLAQMPHLLVGGATGAGKSVGLNAMLLSLLARRTPDELRMVLIDVKRVEFAAYDGIPHLLTPVITEAGDARHALDWSVGEMERRYRVLSEARVRDVAGYREVRHGGMPDVVVVVDELADLMASSRDVAVQIGRLAQKARAAGIHLILATQRPSVDVLTGTIKANFPARLAYRTAQPEDSKTILGSTGAERLLGAGDALFQPPETAQPMRVHGAYVSADDVRAVCDHLRSQAGERYDPGLARPRVAARPPPLPTRADREPIIVTMGGSLRPDSELYHLAVDHVRAEGECSVLGVRRALGVGHARASRLVQEMELAGVVGADGVPRRDGGRPSG